MHWSGAQKLYISLIFWSRTCKIRVSLKDYSNPQFLQFAQTTAHATLDWMYPNMVHLVTLTHHVNFDLSQNSFICVKKKTKTKLKKFNLCLENNQQSVIIRPSSVTNNKWDGCTFFLSKKLPIWSINRIKIGIVLCTNIFSKATQILFFDYIP